MDQSNDGCFGCGFGVGVVGCCVSSLALLLVLLALATHASLSPSLVSCP